MVTYILNIIAKHGHEDAVSDLFESLHEQLERTDGFHSRTIFRAQPGVFLDTVRKVFTEQEIERMARQETPGPDGVHFMIHETWESPEQRVRFARENEREFLPQLVPHLLPEHSHEFYDVVR